MKDFSYFAPRTVSEAVAMLNQHGGKAKVLAGGTDLIVQLREGLREAEAVIDIKHIPDCSGLSLTASGLHVGACTPCYQIYDHPEIKHRYSAVVDAARIIGGWQIQSRASLGGNLCNSSPAADSIPALIALGAEAVIQGTGGTRRIPVREFCTGVGKNILQSGELLVALEFPAALPHSGSAYERFIPRNEMDIAVVGVGAWMRLNASKDRIEDCRISIGAVAPTPRYCEAASKSVIGQAPSTELFAAAGELAKQDASPISDIRGTAEYRMHLVGVIVKRTLQLALERAQS